MARTKSQLAAEADGILEEAITNVRAVFNDAAAPATSRASAVSSALRIYEILKEGDPGEKQPSEMTYDELTGSIQRLQTEQAGAQRNSEDE
jgi:hypothetical protein